MIEISAQEFQKNFSLYQDQAIAQPVTITKHGRPRLVMMSVVEYRTLTEGKPKRIVKRVTEMTPEDLAAIEAAQIPADYAYLDQELDDA